MATDIDTPVGEIMTTPVVSIGADASARSAAEILIARRIGGVPVVDGEGRPLGVVSESDFLSGDEAHREARREAWLRIVAGGQELSESYLENLGREAGLAHQIMKRPAITADAAAPLRAVIELLNRHRIKRVLITRAGKLVGIVTRADLLCHLVGEPAAAVPRDPGRGAERLPQPAPLQPATTKSLAPMVGGEPFSAAALRHAVGAFRRAKREEAHLAHETERARRQAEIAALLDAPYTGAEWTHLMEMARRAAASGASDCQALRFPARLCTDGGRAINVGEPGWPSTLQGKAARFFLRWKAELQPAGFRLAARIATFPGGLPGDAELLLIWGAED